MNTQRPSWPKASGRPGLTAICQKCSRPWRATARTTWSSSPREAPPEVITQSWLAAASRSACATASARSGRMPRSVTRQPSAAEQARAGSCGWRRRSRLRPAAAARLGQLVAGREQRDPHRAGRPAGCARPSVAATPTSCGRSRWPRLQHRLTAADVLAGPAPVGAAADARRDHHRVASQSRRPPASARYRRRPASRAPVRTRSAVPAGRRPCERVAGGRPALEQPQAGRPGGREIGMGEGEAVDRDVVEARHVALGDHRLGQDPAMGFGERHRLCADHRPDALLEQRQRLARRQALAGRGRSSRRAAAADMASAWPHSCVVARGHSQPIRGRRGHPGQGTPRHAGCCSRPGC